MDKHWPLPLLLSFSTRFLVFRIERAREREGERAHGLSGAQAKIILLSSNSLLNQSKCGFGWGWQSRKMKSALSTQLTLSQTDSEWASKRTNERVQLAYCSSLFISKQANLCFSMPNYGINFTFNKTFSMRFSWFLNKTLHLSLSLPRRVYIEHSDTRNQEILTWIFN